MSTNKHAQIRYLALDSSFRNRGRKYYIEDLVIACNQAIYEFTGIEEGVQKRQVYDDIRYMISDQGWNVPLEKLKEGRRVYYRYYDPNFTISKEPLTESEAMQIKETLTTLSRFKGMPQFGWVEEITARLESSLPLSGIRDHVIEFEQNQYLMGLELISPLYNAIVYKQSLQICYQSFKSDKPLNYTISPYFLKQYNSRWFLFGWNHDEKFLMNLALDRIKGLGNHGVQYVENTSYDFTSLFEDVIGVTIPVNAEPEKIRIKVAKELWPYLTTKPLHGSQKVIGQSEEGIELELELYINRELENLLFSFGEELTIIAPEKLREKLLAKAKKIISQYK